MEKMMESGKEHAVWRQHPSVWTGVYGRYFRRPSLSRTTTIGVESRPSFEQSGGRGTVGEVDFYQVGKRLAPIQLHASCFRVSLTAIAYPTSHEGLMLEYEHALMRTLPLPAAARSKSNAPGAGAAPTDKTKPKTFYKTITPPRTSSGSATARAS
jgi:hypothetical protein